MSVILTIFFYWLTLFISLIFVFALVCFCLSHPTPQLSLGLRRKAWQRRDEHVGGGRGRRNRPDLSAWGGAPLQVDLILPRRQPDRAAPPGNPAGPRPPGGHAVHNHGGGSGQRMEEPKLSSKGRIQTSCSSEPSWSSDSGYVCDSAMTVWFSFSRVQEDENDLTSFFTPFK